MAKGNFGEHLKRERELREVTLQEITAATRIGPRFLEALENEDWNKLPGGVFNRGFVRSVARYLGLDEEGLLAEYDLAHAAQLTPVPERQENRLPSPPRWVPLLLAIGLIAVLAGLVVGAVYAWRYYAARRTAKQAAVSAAQAQVLDRTSSTAAVPVPAMLPAPAADLPQQNFEPPLDLLVSVSFPTLVRIQADGKLLLEGNLAAGENRHFSAEDGFEVFAADSSAVLLELNGRTWPPLGATGASGTMTYGRKDLRQAPGGNPQP
jgi:cytoskeleton protein RodZ